MLRGTNNSYSATWLSSVRPTRVIDAIRTVIERVASGSSDCVGGTVEFVRVG